MKQTLTVQEAGRLGAEAKIKKYGKGVMREMINKRWADYRKRKQDNLKKEL